MEIATSAGGTLAEAITTATVDKIWQQIRYVLDHDEHIKNLRDKLVDLTNAKDKVEKQVEEAKGGLQEIHEFVRTWMSRAEEAIGGAEKILKEDGEASKTCCAGSRIPNFKDRYKFSKQAKLGAPYIKELADKGATFDEVGYRVPVHHRVLPSHDYEAFESRESTLDSILEALRKGDADLIGVWGPGGVGKTTLVKEVRKRMKEESVFQLVVLGEVHPKADIKTIQKRIAEWVQIEKEVEEKDSVELRAALLRDRLLKEKSTLVILDDVWDPIDLNMVGIPIGDPTSRCTVLVTTRDSNVVSKMTNTAKQEKHFFYLSVLTHNEAWKLFQKKVGAISEDDPVRHSVATQIVQKCGGLPVLVLPVAAALKDKELYVWKEALSQLQSGLKNSKNDVTRKAYLALELSYNHLTIDQKSLFLFCGLLQPNRIDVEKLVRYTTGLGLFKGCVEATRSKVLKLLDDLKCSCLLLGGDDQEQDFTMHDVVYDFTRGYQEHVFAPGARTVVEEWPDRHELTDISLPYCQLPDPPSMLDCPKLKVFLMYGPSWPKSTLELDDTFFGAVGELKVLDLTGMHLSPLPSSLQHLQKLQTLCLDSYNVEDVAVIGSLNQLQILSLIGAKIVHLPKEIGKLVHLRLLDLNDCRYLKMISPGVLSCLTHLEELYMRNSFTQWGNSDGQQMNAELAELKNLTKLAALEIGVTDLTNLPDDLFSDKLERFFIVIGDCWKWSKTYEDATRTLKLKLDSSILWVLNKVNVLLSKADDLHIDNSRGVNLSEWDMEEGLGRQLKHLRLQNFPEVGYLVNSVQRGPNYAAFPRLESLVIKKATHLEKICNGPLSKESLANLRIVKIAHCDGLRNVFSTSTVNNLTQLRRLEIEDCQILEEIITGTNEHRGTICLPKLETLWLRNLPSLARVCTGDLMKCPNLKELEIYDCPKLKTFITSSSSGHDQPCKSLFDNKVLFPSLEEMRLRNMDSLITIWHEELHQDSFTKLKSLEIERTRSLSKLFSSAMLRKVHTLETLELEDCDSLEEVFDLRSLIISESNRERITSTMLMTEMTALDLPKLKHVWWHGGDDRILLSFPNLRIMQFWRCPSLESLIPASMAQQLTRLEELRLDFCDSLEHIISKEQQQDDDAIFEFPSLKRIKLWDCSRLRSFYPSKHIIDGPALQHLIIDSCPRLEGFSKLEFTDLRVINFVESFPNLEKLKIYSFDWEEELFSCGILGEEKLGTPKPTSTSDHWALSRLQHLSLCDLHALKHIWNSKLDLGDILQNLTSLAVDSCNSLIRLAPPSASFRNLTNLEVWNCESLGGSLFTFSTMKSLVQLREMEIYRCHKLTEIVSVSEIIIQGGGEICLYKLEKLKLSHLESIRSFCSQDSLTLNFPSLVDLVLEDCPQMEFFSRGDLSAPKLEKVWLTWFKGSSCWKGELDTTIREMYTEKRLANEEANPIKEEEEKEEPQTGPN